MAGCLAYGIYWLWGSPVWHWHGNLKITGNRLVSKQEILDRLSVPQNTPLYRLNPQWIQGQLTGVPAISRVAVRRWLFPARLEMIVIERQALVPVVGGANDRWMDQEGFVFSASPKLMKPRYAVKVHTGLQVGQQFPPEVRAPLFELIAAWPGKTDGRVDMRNPKDVFASIDGWPVRLGELDEISTKFGMFTHLKPLAEKYKDRLEYINVRHPMAPTFKLKTGKEINVKKDAKATSASPAPHGAASASPGPQASPKGGSPAPSPQASTP